MQPSLASKKSCGLSQLIYYSVLKCDEKIRPELLSNITLSGQWQIIEVAIENMKLN